MFRKGLGLVSSTLAFVFIGVDVAIAEEGTGIELMPGVEIAIVSLQRQGGAVELKYRVTNDSDVDFLMHENGFQERRMNRDALAVIELLDLVNAKRYGVGWAEHRCLCSDQSQYEPQFLTVPAGQSKLFWAQFAEPPPEVTAITVRFPVIPPVHGVAIGG